MQQLKHIENNNHHYFLDLLFLFLFFNHLGESILDWPLLRLISLNLYFNKSTLPKINSLVLIDSSNPSLYLAIKLIVIDN